jgi:hypothetical protein
MIVRITRVKVGNRQAPYAESNQKPQLVELGLFALVDQKRQHMHPAQSGVSVQALKSLSSLRNLRVLFPCYV